MKYVNEHPEENNLEIIERETGLTVAPAFADVMNDGKITTKITLHALEKMDIDNIGLDAVDRKMIITMIENFKGKPVGLDTLGAVTGEEPDTIEDVYEPYLLQLGFVARTPRGRVALPNAYKHLGRKFSAKNQEYLKLFIESDDDDEQE